MSWYTYVPLGILLVVVTWIATDVNAGLSNHKRGTVTKVVDGDGLIVTTISGKRLDIRIATPGFDAPEWNQPYGAHAKEWLISNALNRRCLLIVQRGKIYGRTRARVIIDNFDIGEVMLSEGLAWAHPRFATAKLRRLERRAKHEGVGLWQALYDPEQPDPIPPWDFRKMEN